jgi:ring-1,2-phenylacetyl-CoA epoxidase subunit PaaC
MPTGTWMQKGGRIGQHTEHLSFMLAEMQVLPRTYPDAKW